MRQKSKTPVRVAITGAAGQIGYQLAFRVASGQLFGGDQPIILQLLEITPALGALNGVAMELDDCAFETLHGVVVTDKAETAFKDINYGLLVGARPRGPGMERKDLLSANAQIFSVQGKAIDEHDGACRNGRQHASRLGPELPVPRPFQPRPGPAGATPRPTPGAGAPSGLADRLLYVLCTLLERQTLFDPAHRNSEVAAA